MAQGPATNNHPVVLFDGVCNLCNATVNFLIRRDRHRQLRFASLQSETGQRLLADHGMDADLRSIVFLDQDGVWERSDAALRIVRYLKQPWPLLVLFRIVPRVLRNAVYNLIAANRYRWFGKRDSCRLPTPAEQAQFIE